jgi:ATP-binding cassette subfamily B protein
MTEGKVGTFMNTPMMPPATSQKADEIGVEIFLMETNIDLDGNSCTERLTANDKYLVVNVGFLEKRRKLRFDRIEEFRIEPSVGSCFLQARIRSKWIDILRTPGNADQQLCNLAERLTARVISRRNISGNTDQSGNSWNDDEGILPSDFSASASKSPPWTEETHSMRTSKLILSLLRPFRGSVVLLLALSLGAVAIDVVPPMLQKLMVDHVLQFNLPANPQGKLIFYLAAIVACLLFIRVAASLIAIWKGIIASRVGTTMTANLRNDLVKKFNELPMAFHDRNQVGALMSQVAYDTETLHTLVYHFTSGFLLQSFQLVGIGVMLFYLNAKLAFITLWPMPLILLGSWYFTRHLQPRHKHYWEAVGKQASALMGMLSGIRVVKAFVQEDREICRFRNSSFRLRDSRMTVDCSSTTFSALMGLLFAMGTLVVWYIGGRDVMSGNMTLGSLMAFLAYLAVFYTPLTMIAESTTWFANFFSVSRRIGEILTTPSEQANADPTVSCPETMGRIEFQDVSFGYDKSRPVLQHINFAVAPGEMIGVVGRSGSGKSTLVSLITRLYEIDSGHILVGGIDVRNLNPRELRRKIGLVPQDPFLFRGSVAENIAYGNVPASPEQIILAAKAADCHDFIMRLSFAYETRLGESGSGLSGGERQRLSIARALLCDPDILILDEATASVDAESEKAICNALRQANKQRTILIIAHRFSILKDADRLLVFDNGKLKEEGTPQGLIDKKGIYAALAKIQGNRNGNGNFHRVPLIPDLTKPAINKANGAGLNQNGFQPVSNGKYELPHPAIFCNARNIEKNISKQGGLYWLDPAKVGIEAESRTLLCVVDRGRKFHGVYAVHAFPGSHEHDFISLRRRNSSGSEKELGLIHSLKTWPDAVQAAVRRSLNRRYLLHIVREIQQIHIQHNHLTVQVATDGGLRVLQIEKPSESCQPFGDNSFLLTDVSGNYFIIPDSLAIPKRQQRLLNLYFGT